MSSTSENVFREITDLQLTGEEIVVSGMSGVFPKSQSVLEFMENLYGQVDMVSCDDASRIFNDPEVPRHMGKITGLDKFDAQFFKVGFQLGCVLEPMARKLLEHTYGAIIDSGSNLFELKKSKVGVFVGSSSTDHSALAMFDINTQRSDFIINGCSKAMLANRISYWVDGKGPSYGLDCACASSMACLEQAYNSMKNGECDAAIVGGCNYCTQPNLTVNMKRAGLLCLDGKTKCFDKNGDGYVRSDAVNVLFLQKAKDAKRIYAEVCHAKGIYKMNPNAPFLPIREPEDMEQLFEEFYSEAKVSPNEVEYIEANGAAIAEADGNELKAIENVFAKDNIVKIGCVKSNMGHSEPASGVCAVTKVCLAYHQGKLPANLHYNEPQDVIGIHDGRLQVVTENEHFNRTYAAINSFSFSGANYHVLLKGHFKKKDSERYKTKIPYLVPVSGRQESSVSKILDIMKSQPVDAEHIALLHNIFAYDIPGHTGRGYTMIDKSENNEAVILSESVSYYTGEKRPLWFVFSGMGSQWPGMGADLMKIPTFAAAIEKCRKVLEPKGIELLKVITELDPDIFKNSLNAFVGIGAVQIGLIDVLNEIGIVPDFIIGHSLGEMACAYHDNTFTAEQLIEATYVRGKMCVDIPHSIGSMAAVGMSYKDVFALCPPVIDIACHNSSESCTISGPLEEVTQFVEKLTKQGAFAKEVACSGIAFHSRYLEPARPDLLNGLGAIIKNPKPRSSKWISTSIPKERWNESMSKYSSAEYHTNNILSPVLFEETTRMIPSNAIVVEIAPHSLLQAILKRSLKECTHIPLTRRGNEDGVKFLLDAIGKLYEVGLNPKIETLYPKIDFPVSTETPLLSHMIDWVHTETWPSVKYKEVEKHMACARDVIISVEDDDYKYIQGYFRDGINVLPEAVILVLAWETLAMYNNMDYRDMSIEFQNVNFHSETILKSDYPLRLSIAITKGSDTFEVSQEDKIIASGIIKIPNQEIYAHKANYEVFEDTDKEILSVDDVYRIMNLRGFDYKDNFMSIHFSTLNHDEAFVQRTNDWVTFLDSLIQLNILARSYNGISIPKFIKRINIAVEKKKTKAVEVDNVKYLNAVLDKRLWITRCGGVEIDNITFVDKPLAEYEKYTIEVKMFIPFNVTENIDVETALQLILQIVAENATSNELRVTLVSTRTLSNILISINDTFKQLGLSKIIINTINIESKIHFDNLLEAEQLYVVEDLFGAEEKYFALGSIIKEDHFVLAIENSVPKPETIMRNNFNVISSMSDGKITLILLKKSILIQEITYVSISQDVTFDWLQRKYSETKKGKQMVLISEKKCLQEPLALIKKLRTSGMENINLMAIDDFNAPRFNPENNIFKEQLRKKLSINIFRNGKWGSFYYTPSDGLAHLHNLTLICSKPGDLESITWKESSLTSYCDISVKVSYSGLSIRDAQIVTGFGGNNALGMDFSGITKNGTKIMGMIPGGSISSIVKVDPNLTWPIPEYWTLEDASTVPLPYVYAYYCLAIRSQIFEGQSVFVTDGASAFGQALISLCLSMKCTVYTYVNDENKKELLLKLYPELNGENIAYSHHDAIHGMVISYSKQKRCDFVINCASGSLREAVMKCVGLSGIFMDISSYDMCENKNIGMCYLEKDRTYKAVKLSNIFEPENVDDKMMLQKLISEGIATGVVKPLVRLVYSPTDVIKAFRLLSSKTHHSRLLINMQDPSILSQGFKISPRLTYSPTSVYVVVSDRKGLGIEFVERLITQGAKKIVLQYNYCITGYIMKKLSLWKSENIHIEIKTENLHTEKDCIELLKDAAALGEVNGIFSVQDVDESKNDKTLDEDTNSSIVKTLDLVARILYPKLSYFVVLAQSSQSNAAEYSTAVFERICLARNDEGFPALLFRIKNKPDSASILQAHTLSSIFSALEKSLKLQYGNVITINKENGSINNGTCDLLKKVAEILEIKTLDDLDEESTIQDLNLNEVNLEEMKSILRKCYQIDYPVEAILRFTISSLKSLEHKFGKKKIESRTGLAAIYNNIELEEDYLSLSHPIVPMITLFNNGTENDLDPNETYLTMIPGFEGHHQIFTSIAERLKVRAVTIQLGPDMMEERSVQELAISARKFMKMKFETKSKFYLLGYSFGVNVALELASVLEKEGHTGVVYCLDSSPDALRVQLDSYLGKLTVSQLQNAVVGHFYYLMSGRRSKSLLNELNNIEDWPDKVELCINSLKRIVSNSYQYKRCVINSLYGRILLAREFDPVFKLESAIVLIKAVSDGEDATILNNDYNLSKYTKQPVTVFDIKSQHTSAPFDSGVSNIVNILLEPSLLDAFKKKNLCSVYVCE